MCDPCVWSAQVLKKRLAVNVPMLLSGDFMYEEGEGLEEDEVRYSWQYMQRYMWREMYSGAAGSTCCSAHCCVGHPAVHTAAHPAVYVAIHVARIPHHTPWCELLAVCASAQSLVDCTPYVCTGAPHFLPLGQQHEEPIADSVTAQLHHTIPVCSMRCIVHTPYRCASSDSSNSICYLRMHNAGCGVHAHAVTAAVTAAGWWAQVGRHPTCHRRVTGLQCRHCD